jgi:hypothetical protein
VKGSRNGEKAEENNGCKISVRLGDDGHE